MILELKTELAVREPPSDTRVMTPKDVAGCVQQIASLAQESFCVLSLNTKNRLIKMHMVSLGSVNQTLVHAREVFRPAIMDGAVSIVVVHNHPSGDPSPSAEDIAITRSLIEAGSQIGIEVLDHVIIGDCDPFSIREAGLAKFN